MKLVATAAALLVAIASASAATLQATANKMLAAASAAIRHRDIGAFDAAVRPNVTADFKYFEGGKPGSYGQMLQQMKLTIGMLSRVDSANAKVLTCLEHGHTGLVTESHEVKAASSGPDRKPHIVSMTGTSQDTWVKVGSGWKLASMRWLTQKMTLDGKPYSPMTGPHQAQVQRARH